MLLWLLGCLITDVDRREAIDRDGDGFVADAVAGGTDCDDTNPRINPDAFESCLDEVDSDCDGAICPPQALVDMAGVVPLLWGGVGDRLMARRALADVDGDGVDDLVLSAPGGPGAAGRVYFLAGPVTGGMDLSTATVVEGLAGEGLRVSGSGDLNGDGADEVFLSAMSVDPARTYVVDGWPDPADPIAATFTGNPSDLTKAQTAEVGEFILSGGAMVFGKGLLLVMAPLDGATGAAYLYGGPLSGDIDLTSVVSGSVGEFRGSGSGDLFGSSSAATAPDVDGDGQPDLLVTAPGFDLLDTDGDFVSKEIGAVYAFSDPTTGGSWTAADADLTLYGSFAEAHIEWAASVGDVNGDGYEDLGVFSHAGPGDLSVFYGPHGGQVLTSEADLKLFGDGTDIDTEDFGLDTVGLDANGDGRGDLLVPAPAEGIFGSPVVGGGASYLFLGPISGVLGPGHADVRWLGGVAEGLMGGPLVADVDGDGASDLFFSAPGASTVEGTGNSKNPEGAVYLLFDAFGGL